MARQGHLGAECDHRAGVAPHDEDIEPMQTARPARAFALVMTILLLALLSAGCGHRTLGASYGNPPSPMATGPVGVLAATAPPAIASATTPAPMATPVPPPDLSAVDALLTDIDDDLQADASAGPNEGTAP